jgi:hypothetical protein
MSKLSPSLKALINAPFARPGLCPAPNPASKLRDVYASIASEAAQRHVGPQPWIALSAAATFTLNSPDSLTILYDLASSADGDSSTSIPVSAVELIREVGLKCIAFNGIPRTINCLTAFHGSLPPQVRDGLRTAPRRTVTPENLTSVQKRGRQLWDSVYAPLDRRLLDKLARAHPDLPVHILGSHYGPLLADPPSGEGESLSDEKSVPGGGKVGRVLTSIVAIACLRAQTGVAPQVISHVLGLRKSLQDGTWEDDRRAVTSEGIQWLASDEGSEWILRSVDRIAEALGGGDFAPARPRL